MNSNEEDRRLTKSISDAGKLFNISCLIILLLLQRKHITALLMKDC
ncbi:MAG: hypothetical protein HXX18_12105 [Bacteroidetes bacterium]|nr:hypothetical protein [Bacteroidota bacterium]